MSAKEIRCRRFANESPAVNERYRVNVPKEELLIEHVRQFERQFLQVYGERFLFLCPPNEFGMAKFLPTTLRPTHLAYRELYDYQSCALFLSDFLNYEQLQPPHRYPLVIPSPASVLKWRAGDCFDFSITLCSLLLGVGYDAYCVTGFAPRYITTGNETRQACPKREKKGGKGKKKKDDDDDDFTIEKKPLLESNFSKQKAAEETRLKDEMDEEVNRTDSDDDPSSDEDEFENERIHCWVLVRRGMREVAEDMFVEPVTGRVYPAQASPFLRIDLLWNQHNLWVNMQQIPVNELALELNNPKYFEPVNRDPSSKTEGENEEAKEDGEVLDIPASWCERLDISREAFAGRCYHGEKTVLYEQAKVESYAPYSQVDGLIERVTNYKDLRRQIAVKVVEKFAQRKDKLVERRRQPMDNELVELFLPGRQNALKEFREKSGVRRELIYYHTSRLDGLSVYMEEIGKKISQTFEDRDDRLVYHSVTFDPSLAGTKPTTLSIDGIGEVPIRKMVRKYDKDPSSKEPQYQKIVFMVAEGKVRVDYHCEPGMVTFHRLILWKDENKLKVEQPTTDAPIPTAQQLNRLLQMEKECTSQTHKPSFVDALTDTHSELLARRKDENNIRAWRSIEREKEAPDAPGLREQVLEPNVYHRARVRAAEATQREGAEEEKAEEATTKVDILAPYLVDHAGKTLDSLSAEYVAKRCKNDFRKRLLERAGIIQRRLEDEQDQLRKRRSQMQRRGENVEKDERVFEEYQGDAMFRIHILEARLARHECLAIKKFAELEKTLAEDPRLAAMWTTAKR
jgi:hypothetical protein